MIVGSCPTMTSLSDRNMSLGDVLLPQGEKQRCLYLRVQGLFTLHKVLLMQLSVALGLHIGWGSQRNTRTLFAISPLFRRRRASKIGAARRPCPGTLPE